MEKTTLTRRTLLRTAAVATTALAAPFVRGARAAGKVVPSGSMVLAWHTNIAPRWLEPLRHDGGATPDNFLNVAQDALIKNFRDELYDHLTLAERYEFAEDTKSATPRRWQAKDLMKGPATPMASRSTGPPRRRIITRGASASSRSFRTSASARSSRSWSGACS
jgi:hypothetical protein